MASVVLFTFFASEKGEFLAINLKLREFSYKQILLYYLNVYKIVLQRNYKDKKYNK